jgi:SAM-dependent methyltransferase
MGSYIGVEIEEYARIAAAEDDHWWYRGTRALVAQLLAPWLSRMPAERTRILDAGCGPGGNGAWLARHGHVTGVDLALEALAFVRARRRGTAPVRGRLDALPLADSSIDVAIAITVLYSVPDDVRAVHELARVLRPGGVVLVVEPAFEALRRAHDRTVHGLRRYRRHPLARRFVAAGLEVQRATYAYSFLAPPAAALGLLERRATTGSGGGELRSDLQRQPLERVFAPLSALERRWLARRDVLLGSSVVVVATRPE